MRKLVFFIVLAVIGLLFGGAGVLKVIGDPQMAERMNEIGYGYGWRKFIGITEILGVAGFLSVKFRPWALICLAPYAIGGLAVHISHGHPFERSIAAAVAMLLIPLALSLDQTFRIVRRNA